MSTNIFSSEESTQISPEQSQEDALTTMLSSIKNENGEQKYQSLDKAIEALQHSQSYIPELKTQLTQRDEELANLRMELAKQQGVQETIERFSQSAQKPEQKEHQPEVKEDTQDIEALVSQHMQNLTAKQQEEKNMRDVTETVMGVYGEKANDFIVNKSKELGLTTDHLEQMAKTSPKAALALLGVETKHSRNFSGVNAGSYRTDNLQPKKEPLGSPEKSLMRGGAKNSDFKSYMQQIKAEVYSDLGVQD